MPGTNLIGLEEYLRSNISMLLLHLVSLVGKGLVTMTQSILNKFVYSQGEIPTMLFHGMPKVL